MRYAPWFSHHLLSPHLLSAGKGTQCRGLAALDQPTASTGQAREGMSRRTAGKCNWPDRTSYYPQLHSSARPATGRDEHQPTSVARGPPCPQRRSCCPAHQQDGAQDGAADDYAQDEDGEHQDAIQYQSVILWTTQGAELVMADFLGISPKIRLYRRQAASPVRAPVRRPACGPSDAMGCVRNAPRHYPTQIPSRRATDQRLILLI